MNPRMKKIDTVIIIIMIIIAGFVLYRVGLMPKTEESNIPDIQFIKDDANKTLTVKSVSSQKVLWNDDIEIEGECDKSNLGKYVSIGDQITDCIGVIYIRHKPTDTLLYTFKFASIPKLPSSILLSNMRDVSPEDEGVHFNTIANIREWW